MRSFLEQAGAAREAASEVRRHITDLEVSDLGPILKRSDRLEAQGAEYEYRWLALTGQPQNRPSRPVDVVVELAEGRLINRLRRRPTEGDSRGGHYDS